MSADNGIYILKTPSATSLGIQLTFFEYRVIHAQAIGNIHYTPEVFIPEIDKPINALELIRYFGKAKVLGERGASLLAEKMEKEIGYLEYGVCSISLNKPFDEYMVEAGKELVAHKLFELNDETSYTHWSQMQEFEKDRYRKEADELISAYQDPTQD